MSVRLVQLLNALYPILFMLLRKITVRKEVLPPNTFVSKLLSDAGNSISSRAVHPEKALFAGADGLDFYRRISEEAPKYLKPGGKIYLEIGYTQAEAVSLLLFQNGFSGIRTVQDLSGKDRVVRADLLQETEK